MPKLPRLTAKRVITLLLKHGFVLDHSTGSHQIFYHPTTHCRVTVPFHNRNLLIGTLYSILKQSGIPRDEFR
ncbi:type II toxin-antitoxin system HicA family toxin [Candidatus Berkelbacteria bacterium]|nr:type II toxin-antitoxin system HicA family toxin [Candidatus Berkelbacteria bacterium]